VGFVNRKRPSRRKSSRLQEPRYLSINASRTGSSSNLSSQEILAKIRKTTSVSQAPGKNDEDTSFQKVERDEGSIN